MRRKHPQSIPPSSNFGSTTQSAAPPADFPPGSRPKCNYYTTDFNVLYCEPKLAAGYQMALQSSSLSPYLSRSLAVERLSLAQQSTLFLAQNAATSAAAFVTSQTTSALLPFYSSGEFRQVQASSLRVNRISRTEKGSKVFESSKLAEYHRVYSNPVN